NRGGSDSRSVLGPFAIRAPEPSRAFATFSASILCHRLGGSPGISVHHGTCSVTQRGQPRRTRSACGDDVISAHAARDNEVVHAACRPALHGLAFLIPVVLYASGSQATIEDTGSTNRPGLRVTFDHGGHATVEQRNGQIDQVKLPSGLCSQFMRDLKEVG